MILHFNFEELRALASAAEVVAGGGVPGTATPSEWAGRVEQLIPRLTGDLSIGTLDDQRRVREVVSHLVTQIHGRLDEQVLATHPGNEDAIALYFDYAHSRTVLDRLDRMGAEMEAIVELIGGGNAAAAGGITFPD